MLRNLKRRSAIFSLYQNFDRGYVNYIGGVTFKCEDILDAVIRPYEKGELLSDIL